MKLVSISSSSSSALVVVAAALLTLTLLSGLVEVVDAQPPDWAQNGKVKNRDRGNMGGGGGGLKGFGNKRGNGGGGLKKMFSLTEMRECSTLASAYAVLATATGTAEAEAAEAEAEADRPKKAGRVKRGITREYCLQPDCAAEDATKIAEITCDDFVATYCAKIKNKIDVADRKAARFTTIYEKRMKNENIPDQVKERMMDKKNRAEEMKTNLKNHVTTLGCTEVGN